MCLRLKQNNKYMSNKTIEEAVFGYNLVGKVIFKKGVAFATKWRKIDVNDTNTFPEENEPVLVKDGEWLFVGVRHGCVFFTDIENIEITNDIEWRLINFK